MAEATAHPSGRLVVVGASAGGVEALKRLVGALPIDLPAPVLVTVHLAAGGPSVLPEVLDRAGPLPAAAADDGAPLEPGHILVARPDCHLLVHGGHVRLAKGPTEHGHRPSIDALFQTAARWYGPAVVGVILSGVLDDGAAGLATIKSRGGVALVQHPDDAMFGDMPRNAMAAADVDGALPIVDLAAAIAKAVDRRADAWELRHA